MIRKLVDFALQNRLLVLAVGIAQWPGISAEQIEQQVTIPLEIVMNGIPGVQHVRSWSIFGLSTVELVFG